MKPDTQSNRSAFLCLRFDHLSLNSLGLSYSSNSSYASDETQTAVAVSYQQRVHCINKASLQSGVERGMSISHALLINPSLELHHRDDLLERQKLQELSYWAYRFTSRISQHNDHTLILEIGKSSKLFNGLEHILNLIKKDLLQFKIDAFLGLAETPKASVLLSLENHQQLETSRNQLNKISLSHLEIPPKKIAQLQHCGFKTLGEIKNIEYADLGLRFGQDLLDYLRLVEGDLADPQETITPPEVFHACADFAEPIHNVTWIQQQIDRLLNDLAHFIKSRQLLCRSFVWQFYHENNRLIKTIEIGISSQKNLNTTLKQLSDIKLQSIKLDWEFSRIELSCRDLLPVLLFDNDLFDPKPNREQFQQLRDKLISRLGNKSLYGIEALQEHLPEISNRQFDKHTYSPLEKSVAEKPTNYRVNTTADQALPELNDEPLWLLDQPLKLAKQAMKPILKGPLTLIHGPNRVSTQWWVKLQSRDYFIARQSNGRLLWIYFDRVKKNWFVHGLFA